MCALVSVGMDLAVVGAAVGVVVIIQPNFWVCELFDFSYERLHLNRTSKGKIPFDLSSSIIIWDWILEKGHGIHLGGCVNECKLELLVS